MKNHHKSSKTTIFSSHSNLNFSQHKKESHHQQHSIQICENPFSGSVNGVVKI
ncbi:hypothetical protein MtrunA17_Chr2g0277561 [Medicago truncatula]|uniref:Uncharacterized protein n=1 Tax=Medicago truncatula TaxID=3880 RepID=A0A396J2A0_MEDTR|nr:hypothetical protein MtrunA17_Chr2g0277561 [Medicago truncatula]